MGRIERTGLIVLDGSEGDWDGPGNGWTQVDEEVLDFWLTPFMPGVDQ